MTLTQTLPARTTRARSLYLGQLIDNLRCARVEGGQSDYGSLRRLSEEAAQMAYRLAFDARILWNAAQEHMFAMGTVIAFQQRYSRAPRQTRWSFWPWPP